MQLRLTGWEVEDAKNTEAVSLLPRRFVLNNRQSERRLARVIVRWRVRSLQAGAA
jgi:hypothetical protein